MYILDMCVTHIVRRICVVLKSYVAYTGGWYGGIY